jgi:hypothetical protein
VKRLPRHVVTAAPLALLVLVVAVLVAGAVQSTRVDGVARVVAPATPVVSRSCPMYYAVYAGLGPTSPAAANRTVLVSGSIPTDFEPTAFRLCALEGTTTAEPARTRVVGERTGDVTVELMAALHRPDAEGDPSCPTFTTSTVLFFLVDAEGRSIRPHLPEALCGATRASVLEVIDHLPYNEKTFTILGPEI